MENDNDTLKMKLDTLLEDMTACDREIDNVIRFSADAKSAGKDAFKDYYFYLSSLCKVSSFDRKIRCDGDMYGKMSDISEGYDRFMSKMEKKASDIQTRRKEALTLFCRILNLPEPYNEILYLRYFKRLSCKDIRSILFMSRSSFYRKKDEAVRLLSSDHGADGEREVCVV